MKSVMVINDEFKHPSFDVDFSATVWVFNYDVAGQHKERIAVDWSFSLGCEGRFTDPKNSRLLHEMKVFLRAAILDDAAGVRMQVGSITATFMGIRELAIFMVKRKLDSLSCLTAALSWEYVEGLEEQYTSGDGEVGRRREWTHASAYKLLHPLTQIFLLAPVLVVKGGASPCEAPFNGRSTYDVVVGALGLAKSGRLAPVPDDVAIPVLCEAALWLEYGAHDLERLLRLVLPMLESSRSKVGSSRLKALAEIRNEIESFAMTIDPQTGKPWHEELKPGCHVNAAEGGEIGGLQLLRRMVLGFQAACTILIQACTGMRAHEVIGLRVVGNESAGYGIFESVPSADGLMEVMTIVGTSAKRQASQHRWTAGVRPLGTSYLPIPIAAVSGLVRVLAYWRVLSDIGFLSMTFTAAKSLPVDASGVGRMTASRNSLLQRDFAAAALVRRCGMSFEVASTTARSIRPQRWRPTFAHYVFRTKPTLLGPLRDHFRHVSEQITDHGYIGSDAALLEDLEGERVVEAARMFAQISLGRPIGAGPAARLIREYSAEASAALAQMSGKTLVERAVALVKTSDIRIWTGTYASCLIDIFPQRSSCNPQAAFYPGRAAPNFGLRSPGLCAGCQCCVVLPEHEAFWEQRLAENLRIVSEERPGRAGKSRASIATRRVSQSRSILKRLREVNAQPCDDLAES